MSTDIELDIERHGERGHYQVRVVRSPAGGDPREEFELDIDALLRSRPQLEASILSSSVGSRRVMSTAERPVLEAGRHLFERVFTRSVYGAYRASLGVAQQQGERLRVVLRLSEPELAALPWEALFDPERQSYVCRQEPMVRRIPAQFNPRAPLQVTPPLQVLAMVASPRGLVPLDVELERANLEEALQDLIAAGLVKVTWVERATWRSVHRHLLSGHWHVVHFIGHGDYDDARDEGVLAFVGSDGRADMVEAGRFADLLGEADPTPRLVVLNACSSGESGGNDMLSAIAPALVHSGIEAVAAMQFAVSDDAAIAFAQGFYTAVAHSRGVDEAARSGRIAILGAAGSLEWLTPVLYLRGDSTHPILVAPRADTPAGPAPAPAAGPAPGAASAGWASARTPADERVGGVQHAVGGERQDAAEPRDAPERRDGFEQRDETAVIPLQPGLRTPHGPRAEPAPRRPRAPRDEPAAPVTKPPGSPGHEPPRAPRPGIRQGGRPGSRPGIPRRVWAALATAAIVVLVVGLVALRPRADSGGSAGGTTPRLSERVALLPVRDPTNEFTRLMTFDTSTQDLQPWAGAADQLEDGGTPDDVDRFSATPSPDRTRVAYLEGADDGLPVPFVAKANGAEPRRLMSSPSRPCENTKRPAWSADGSQLAVVCIFAAERSRELSWSLWIVDAQDGAGVREVVAEQSGSNLGAPTWDADGHLIYTWEAPPPDPDRGLGILGRPMVVPDDADQPTRPEPVSGISHRRYTEADWAPPGLLMVHRPEDGENRVVVVSDGEVTVAAEGPYLNATWSPDHRSILATTGQDPADLQLVVLPYPGDGSAPTDTGVVGGFGAPNWGTR